MVTPLFKVFMAADVEDFISPVIHSGYVGDGPMVEKFEKELGDYVGNPRVLAVNSGTSAITLALRLTGVGYGDMVITTPMTCLATNMAILSLGAHPIWADVLEDGTIDPEDVERKMEGCKAIVCVDLGGIPCKLDELRNLGLPVIEDAAQSFGAVYKGRKIGNDADYVCFSFQAIKYLTSVDGGAIAFGDGNVEDARLMRWFGLDRKSSASFRSEQDPPFWGYKFHMNDVIASIGMANLRHIDELLEQAKRNANVYNERFRWLHNVMLLNTDKQRESSYWSYTILVDDRDKFTKYMLDHGVEVSPIQCRNDKKTIFKPYETYLPTLDYFDRHQVNIPVGWWVDNPGEIADLVVGYG